MASLLEPELTPDYEEWKKAGTPEANAKMLGRIQPMIDQAIQAHVGPSNPLLVSRARRMALDALRGYDPSRARLRTHLFNQLQGLKRVSRQQSAILHVPERVSLDRYHLERHTQELTDKLGREPSDDELADATGFSPRRLQRVRSYLPAVAEGTLESADPEGRQQIYGGVIIPQQQQARADAVRDLVYGDLSPQDKLIMEHTLGMGGRRPLSNQQIAAKLGRSPGLISQRKAAIQQMLDRASEISPF